eukprot:Skav232982  [mRNA]  locus=scaffold1735:515668:516264:+ [translate_table: standard]
MRSNSNEAIGNTHMDPDFQVTIEGRQWENVTVSEAKRMRLNGETRECMAHIRAIKKAGGVSLKESDGADTSKDQDWPLDESCGAKFADWYCYITTFLWLGPKAVIFVPALLLLQAPGLLLIRCYAASLKPGTEKVERTGMFWMSFLLFSVLFLPAGLLAFVSLMLRRQHFVGKTWECMDMVGCPWMDVFCWAELELCV